MLRWHKVWIKELQDKILKCNMMSVKQHMIVWTTLRMSFPNLFQLYMCNIYLIPATLINWWIYNGERDRGERELPLKIDKIITDRKCGGGNWYAQTPFLGVKTMYSKRKDFVTLRFFFAIIEKFVWVFY